jgi:hypothetical protein
MTFSQIRSNDCLRTLAYLRSRNADLGVPVADVRAFWRRLGSAGHADNVLTWLEEDKLVIWSREQKLVFLTGGGD